MFVKIFGMYNYQKHKVLKCLYKSWKEGEDETTSSYEVTDFGRSLTVIELHKRTNVKIETVEKICITFCDNEFIKRLKEDVDNKSHRYLILDAGKTAVFENTFLFKVWLFNVDFWKWVLPFLVGALGLLNSIFHWVVRK